MIRKAVVLVLVALLVGPPAWAYVYSASIEKRIPVEDMTVIKVSNPNGLIKIRPGDGDFVELEAKKIVKAKNEEEGKALAEDLRVHVSEGRTELEIEVEIPSRYRGGSGIGELLGFSKRVQASVELFIEVPSSMKVLLSSTSGDIDVEGMGGGGNIGATSGDIWIAGCSGDFSVGAASGDIEIEDIEGDLELSSASGDLTVRNIRGSVDVSIASGDFVGRVIDGSFRLGGASGSVTVESCDGKVDINTASGDVWLKDIVADLSVDTSSGDVTVYAVRDGRVDVGISCSSGDIELVVPRGGSYRLEIGSVSGSIHCKVPLSIEKVTRHELRGVVGSGGGAVSLSTSSGDIKIHEG